MPSFNAQEDDCLREIPLAPLVSDGRGELKEGIYGDKMTACSWQSGKSSPGVPLQLESPLFFATCHGGNPGNTLSPPHGRSLLQAKTWDRSTTPSVGPEFLILVITPYPPSAEPPERVLTICQEL